MADRNAVEFIFSATDRVTPTVEKLKNELKIFGASGEVLVDLARRTQTATDNLDTSFTKVTRSVRALTIPIASELAPALGTAATQMTSVVTSATAMGTGLLAVGVVAAGAAAIIGGQLLSKIMAARQAMLDFNFAMQSFDGGKIAGEIGKVEQRLEDLDRKFRELQDRRGQRSVFDLFSLQSPLEQRETARGRVQDEASRLVDLRAAQRRIAESFEPGQTNAEFNAARSRDASTIFGNQLSQRGLLDFTISPQAAAIADINRRAEDLERGVGGGVGDPAAAARLRATGPAVLRQFTLQFQALAIEGIEEAARSEGLGAGIELPPDLVERARQAIFASERREFIGREAAPEPGIEDSGRSESGGLGDVDAFARGRRAVNDSTLRDAERLNELSVERALILERTYGLTRDQQVSLSLIRIDTEAIAVKTNNSLTDDEQKVRLFALQAEATNRIRENLERVDAGAGLAAGFREVADLVESAGTRMRDGVIRSFHDINDAFADVVIAGLTGQAGKLGDIGKRLGESLLRGLVEQATTRVTGSIFNSVGGLLPGGRTFGAGAAVAGALVAPAGVGAGTLVPAGAGAGRITATGAVQPVASTAGSPAYGAGGDASIGFPTSGLGSLLPSGNGGSGFFSGFFGAPVNLYDAAIAYAQGGLEGVAALQSGQAIVSGGELILNVEGTVFGSASAAGTLEAAGGTGLSSAAGAGAVAAQALGVIGGLAALGFGTYSALQTSRTTTDVALNALSGAASGALVGSVFGPVGTVVGAVAGAAIQGGASAIGKSENKAHGPRTGLVSFQEGETGRQALQTAIQNAQNLGDISAIFNKRWAPNGEVQVFVRPAPGGGIWWAGDYDDPATHVFSEADFTDQAVIDNVHVWVGQGGATVEDRRLTEFLKQRIVEVIAQEARALVAFEERFDAPGLLGTAVSRLTVLPSTRLQDAAGKQILFSRDQALLAEFDEDQIEQLMRRMAKVDRDRNLGFVDAEHLIF